MIARTDRNLLDEPHGRDPLSLAAEMPGRAFPFLQMIWRRRWTVLVVVLLSLAAAIAYVLTATPIYTSTSRVDVEQTGPQIFGDESVMAHSDTYLNTQAEMLTSTPILTNAIAASNARAMKSFSGVSENLVMYLKRKLTVEVGRKDEIISVSFDSPYPQEASDLVNAVVDAYVTHQSGQKHSTAAQIMDALQREKTKRDLDLAAQMRAAVEFKQKNGALSFDTDKGNVVVDKLSQLTEALVQAQVDTVAAGLRELAAY